MALSLSTVNAPPAPGAEATPPPASLSLYWFVPDGMRAEPGLFNIYRWAGEGRLLNIRRLMQRGTYGFCKPAFPSHTPANFACLFTGCYPERHGVNDGPMRTEGAPLAQVSVAGFSSTAKKVEPLWVTLEKALDCPITLLSVPGSTPPELNRGVTIRGRWGRGGADFHAVNFQDGDDAALPRPDSSAARLFYLGAPLTQYVQKQPAHGWHLPLASHSPPWELTLTAWGAPLHAALLDSTDNDRPDYDRLLLSRDKQTLLASLRRGQWSDWLPITVKWQVAQPKLEQEEPTSVRVKVIRLETNGCVRLRLLFDNLNPFQTEPAFVAGELQRGVGLMVDFVDNFPPQLIYCPEDKETFLEEAEQSLTWHADAVPFILRQYRPRVSIHDTYTPNQMLTSRWWLGYLDPDSDRYDQVNAAQREQLWREVHELYRKLDVIIGRLLDHANAQTYVVVSSDHGAVPLNQQVRLNNLFAREGLLKFHVDERTGAKVIDWARTKVVYIQMQSVFLHPEGLAGNWRRGSGPAYEALRSRVKRLLLDLRDAHGVRPVEQVSEWEQAGSEFRLMAERAGDLILANRAGYGWTEELSPDLGLFSVPLIAGYKQALLPGKTPGVWTPFLIAGPGVKPGHFLGNEPVDIVDQCPTLLRALGVAAPAWMQGKVLPNIFK